MADVLTTGVWNRIMISDLGFAATPVGILVSLRYFLAPLGVWAGRVSDRRRILGFRRLFWVWLGRAMMAISTITLGFQTAHLAQGAAATTLVWAGLALSLLLFSLGHALSGSTFLALIYDRAGPDERGRAVGVVWTFLLTGFMVGGIFFALLLPPDRLTGFDLLALPPGLLFDDGPGFTASTVLVLFIVAGVVMGALWFFSVWGEERRARPGESAIIDEQDAGEDEHSSSAMADLRLAWISRPMRFFMFYLSLSMIFAFSQDLVLEPFAGDLFDMSARQTTRFSAYWGVTAILGTILFLYLSRKFRFFTHTILSYIGVAVLIVAFALFSLSALATVDRVIMPGLLLLGLGLGVWNVGTLGLMMDMSPAGRAGTFLGFWTLVVTFSRGLGVSSGGIVRDIVLQLSGSLAWSYGFVFVLGLFGLVLSLYTLSQVNIRSFSTDQAGQAAEPGTILAGAVD
jgi:MFS transporter, BCD family, chlorophyll transporter